MNDIFSSKILVVDDNQDSLDLIETFLDDEGYADITCVLNAKQAYAKLEESTFDLIILDIMMPDVDGIEACKYIKSKKEYEDVPIIIATAKTDLETLRDGFEAGANDYVRKPITNDIELLSRVKNALNLKHNITCVKEMNATLEERVKTQVNDLRKKDEILFHQAKLASMGEMIGAIAHQWRQPLNALNINIQNLEEDYEEGLIDEKFVEEFMSKNRNIIEFMSKTIDDFRNFFRIDKQMVDFSVKEAIDEVISIQSAQLKHHDIDMEVLGDDFIVKGYKSEFGQVLLNVINNAKDILVEKDVQNAKITIELNSHEIKIIDNGGGIPEDIIGRVFEPYFTTKEQGKGTGMGLYMSKMIIEDNMNGKIEAYNKEDGAMIKITF